MENRAQRLGIVSNCFQQQLRSGASLDALVSTAVDRGYRCIELRQGSLGALEGGDGRSDAAGLARLAQRFSAVEFNAAVPAAFLTSPGDQLFDQVKRGLDAAAALAPHGRPHLRLVDLTTTDADLACRSAAAIGADIARLAALASSASSTLSLEHGRQSWSLFAPCLVAARRALGRHAEVLQLCFDPCNLLGTPVPADPRRVAETLDSARVAMVHLKQVRAGAHLPHLTHGDVDWRQQLEALGAIGYAGPLLFEIAPSADVWSALETSQGYLRELSNSF